MATYTCKWCARQSSDPSIAINGNCNNSPHKQHELMNATEKLGEYVCKYCARKSSNPSIVINGNYNNSPHPNKAHELLG